MGLPCFLLPIFTYLHLSHLLCPTFLTNTFCLLCSCQCKSAEFQEWLQKTFECPLCGGNFIVSNFSVWVITDTESPDMDETKFQQVLNWQAAIQQPERLLGVTGMAMPCHTFALNTCVDLLNMISGSSDWMKKLRSCYSVKDVKLFSKTLSKQFTSKKQALTPAASILCKLPVVILAIIFSHGMHSFSNLFIFVTIKNRFDGHSCAMCLHVLAAAGQGTHSLDTSLHPAGTSHSWNRLSWDNLEVMCTLSNPPE